jgi:hypothetical protein
MSKSGIIHEMPFDDYLAVEALDFSLAKWMLASPLDCWARSWLNPNKEDADSPAMTNGRAMHCRVIEPETFARSYVPKLDPADYPLALRTVDDMKEACRRLELKVGGNRADLVERLKPHDDVVMWDDIVSEYGRENAGAEFLDRGTLSDIEIAAKMIEAHPQLSKCFKGGSPEVSVFWKDGETGTPMKCRIDYLKPKAICEYKTFNNIYGKSVDRAIFGAIASGRYQIQAVFQKEGLKACGDIAERQFLWVFQAQGIAPVARGHILSEGALYQAAIAQYQYCVREFARCLEVYGADPWVDPQDIQFLDDMLIPAYATED